jgi:hypothetical protein
MDIDDRRTDRPPIGRFLLMFAALLTAAIGLAELSSAAPMLEAAASSDADVMTKEPSSIHKHQEKTP